MEAEAPPCGGDAPAPACPWSGCGLLPLREYKAKARTVWAGNGSPVSKGWEAPYDVSREGRHHEEAKCVLSAVFRQNVIDGGIAICREDVESAVRRGYRNLLRKEGEPADGRLSDEDLVFVAENMDIDEYITYNAVEILREIENEAQRRFKIRYWS